jgi:hypothetical protein
MMILEHFTSFTDIMVPSRETTARAIIATNPSRSSGNLPTAHGWVPVFLVSLVGVGNVRDEYFHHVKSLPPHRKPAM